MRIVLLAISLLAAICCAAQSSSFLNTDKVSELSGKIRNYQPNENNRLLTVRIFSVYRLPQLVNTPINSDGSFTIQFIQPYTADIEVKFAGIYFSIYFIAGAKETIEIDEKLLLEGENIAQAISMSGESGTLTLLIKNFQYALGKQQWKTQVASNDTSKTDIAVIDMFVQLMQEQLAYLETYSKQNDIRNAAFRSWMKNEILYNIGSEAISNMQSGERGRKYTFPDILHIIKHFPVNNAQGLHHSAYYGYINFVSGTITWAYNARPVYAELRLKTGNNAIAYASGLIDSISTGEARQLLYLNLFLINGRKAEYYQQDFERVVLDKHLRQKYLAVRAETYGPFKEFNLVEKLKASKADSSVKSRLIQLFTAEKDKFVYLDFWGHWCEPCMEEMPFYSRFIDRFRGKNIIFVFMGVNTPEKESLKIKNRYRINGKFISLNRSEAELIQSLLGVQGYPSHTLLKPGSIATGYIGYKIARENMLAPEAIKSLETFLANAQ